MNRYVPNEPSSPVPLDMLTLLMRCDDERATEVVGQLSETQRANLALYCFARSHMRTLGLRIARDCTGRSLMAAGGVMGRTLLDQIGNEETFDTGPLQHRKRKVTLARSAA